MSARNQAAHPEEALARARLCLAENQVDAAHAAYLEVLARDPMHLVALHELGRLAHAEGFSTAACTIYQRIVEHWPADSVGHVNLGNILYEKRDLAGAMSQFKTALALDAGSTNAHRGLGRIWADEGDDDAATRHWQLSFPGQATSTQAFRGNTSPVHVLLLVSARGGNIPTRAILDDRRYAMTALYAEYYKPELPLPPHAMVFNAIGDADLCITALALAEQIVARSGAPVINRPAIVRRSGRVENAARLANIRGVRAPVTLALPRNAPNVPKALEFPVLMRAPGFHTGQYFAMVETPGELESVTAEFPGERLLAIE